MTEQLKPVPCGCGGEAEVLKFNNETWLVMCNKCRTSSENYTSKDKAITAWNRAMGERTAEVETYTDDQQETWSVCECGTDVWKSYNYCPECGAKLEWSEHE